MAELRLGITTFKKCPNICVLCLVLFLYVGTGSPRPSYCKVRWRQVTSVEHTVKGYKKTTKISPVLRADLILDTTGGGILWADEIHLVDRFVNNGLPAVLVVLDRHLWPPVHPRQYVSATLLLSRFKKFVTRTSTTASEWFSNTKKIFGKLCALMAFFRYRK